MLARRGQPSWLCAAGTLPSLAEGCSVPSCSCPLLRCSGSRSRAARVAGVCNFGRKSAAASLVRAPASAALAIALACTHLASSAGVSCVRVPLRLRPHVASARRQPLKMIGAGCGWGNAVQEWAFRTAGVLCGVQCSATVPAKCVATCACIVGAKHWGQARGTFGMETALCREDAEFGMEKPLCGVGLRTARFSEQGQAVLPGAVATATAECRASVQIWHAAWGRRTVETGPTFTIRPCSGTPTCPSTG